MWSYSRASNPIREGRVFEFGCASRAQEGYGCARGDGEGGVTHDDKVCLKLGQEIVRMIRELQQVTKGERGYLRRTLRFPNGEAHLFIANNAELADLLEMAASGEYVVDFVTPPSQCN
jgi:hypothetical protein